MIAIVTRACVGSVRGVTPGEVDWVWVTLSVDSSSGTWSAFQLDIYLIHVCMSVVMLLLGMSLFLFAVRRSSFVFFLLLVAILRCCLDWMGSPIACLSFFLRIRVFFFFRCFSLLQFFYIVLLHRRDTWILFLLGVRTTTSSSSSCYLLCTYLLIDSVRASCLDCIYQDH